MKQIKDKLYKDKVQKHSLKKGSTQSDIDLVLTKAALDLESLTDEENEILLERLRTRRRKDLRLFRKAHGMTYRQYFHRIILQHP